MSDSLKALIQRLREFNRVREWDQFHDPKNLALAISIEASELNETFLWKKPEEANIDKIKEELADIFLYSLQMADRCGLDVAEICNAKIDQNELKYPAEKAKGSNKKYNEL